MSRKLSTTLILALSILLLGTLLCVHTAIAAEDPDRAAQWHQTQYYTTPWGGYTMLGGFGPDVGVGEQGQVYESYNPMTGSYMSYRTTGMGMGMGGPMMGYWGMYSPAAQASYGPYAGGNMPQVQPTPGYNTQGYLSGNLWGQNTSYYSAQPDPMAMMMIGMMSMFGGFGGGWGGYSGPYAAGAGYNGWGGFGNYGGWGLGSMLGGYPGGGYATRIY